MYMGRYRVAYVNQFDTNTRKRVLRLADLFPTRLLLLLITPGE